MKASGISASEAKLIESLVGHYEKNAVRFKVLVNALHTLLTSNDALIPHIHSIKWRVKEPSHLRDKLYRKLKAAKEGGKSFDYTQANLFTKINDLAGVRILHLHTSQIEQIDTKLKELLAQQEYKIVEGPFASTWDDEYRALFEALKIETRKSKEMYTSVHYVIGTGSTNPITAELQVRTLAEELWGEVAHTIDYPHPSKILACREQIKVLARVTSTCTRLVDAIFRVHKDEGGKVSTANSEAKPTLSVRKKSKSKAKKG